MSHFNRKLILFKMKVIIIIIIIIIIRILMEFVSELQFHFAKPLLGKTDLSQCLYHANAPNIRRILICL